MENINAFRKSLNTKLDKALTLDIEWVKIKKAVGTPFFLSYQHKNNCQLLKKYSAVIEKSIQSMAIPLEKKKPGNKIGIICGYFRKHSVMDYYFNTLVNIPKEFDVTLVYTNQMNKKDPVSTGINKRANNVIGLTNVLQDSINVIQKEAFDMIIYPEIGMNNMSYFLAMLRLAPIQLTIIGHPDTTGFKQLDYYVSWKEYHRYEKKSQAYFSETLVQLNEIPTSYEFPKQALKKQLDYYPLKGIKPTDNLYFVPMTAFKISPLFDEALIKILKKDPIAHILCVKFKKIDEIILRRLKKQLTKKELMRLHFNDMFLKDDYYKVLAQSM